MHASRDQALAIDAHSSNQLSPGVSVSGHALLLGCTAAVLYFAYCVAVVLLCCCALLSDCIAILQQTRQRVLMSQKMSPAYNAA